jgi:hypothetical protein
MKTLHTKSDCSMWFNKDGFPEKPNEEDFSGYRWKENQANQEYNEALSKAFDAVVPVDESVFKILWENDHSINNPISLYNWRYLKIKPLTAYDIPSGYSVDVRKYYGDDEDPDTEHFVAYLVPVPSGEEKENKEIIYRAPHVPHLKNNNIGNAATAINFLSEYIHGLWFGRRQNVIDIALMNAKRAIKRLPQLPESEEVERENWVKVISEARTYTGRQDDLLQLINWFKKEGFILTRKP